MNRNMFEERISLLQNQLLAIAAAKLSPNEAEDAVQNAILSAWVHLPQLRNDDAFDAWIKRILVNECNLILRNKVQQEVTDARIRNEMEARLIQEDSPLIDALAEIDEDNRKLLLLHYEQGFTINEISKKLGSSENAIKMRLYRARKLLRVILLSLLLLILSMAIAVGTGVLDVSWFFMNRRAEPISVSKDDQLYLSILTDSRHLNVEITDGIWDVDALTLHITYALSGIDADTLTVFCGNIGVDGIRHDHIWIDGQILPVKEWAQGRKVHVFQLDGWRMNGNYLNTSEDFLPDGKGEAFFSSLCFDTIALEQFQNTISKNNTIMLENSITLIEYATGKIIEESSVRIEAGAPITEKWESAYEEYDH